MAAASYSPESMRKEKRTVAANSVFAALAITALKIVVGVTTGSLGILSEAAHSGLDLIAAIITLLSVRVSDKPADSQHQYGHGKFESLLVIEARIQLGAVVAGEICLGDTAGPPDALRHVVTCELEMHAAQRSA